MYVSHYQKSENGWHGSTIKDRLQTKTKDYAELDLTNIKLDLFHIKLDLTPTKLDLAHLNLDVTHINPH